jgi:hypothetical protein
MQLSLELEAPTPPAFLLASEARRPTTASSLRETQAAKSG